MYKTFEIPKCTGGARVISSPPSSLLWLQRRAYSFLLPYYRTKVCAHGFVPERSIVTNSRIHTGRRLIANFDLRNFFPSIHFGRVKGVFMSHPFLFGDEAATVLAQIACRDDGAYRKEVLFRRFYRTSFAEASTTSFWHSLSAINYDIRATPTT